jgi:hypothetical protein
MSVHPESLLKQADKPVVTRPVHNGKNNPTAAPLEILLKRSMEQLGHLTAVIAECSTAQRPEDNSVADNCQVTEHPG